MIVLTALLLPQLAMADAYTCAKMIYKDGWLRKYELLGNTWGANTQKHGAVSSTTGSSIEKTTSSMDPGVFTGQMLSTVQYSSSWGECSMLDMYITKQMREEFIEQNLGEIKREVAMGQGHFVDSLAFVSGCKNLDQAQWSQELQQRTADFYDTASGKEFAGVLDQVIEAQPDLKSNCAIL